MNQNINPTPLPVSIDIPPTNSITGIYASSLQSCVTVTGPAATTTGDQAWCWGRHHALPDRFSTPAQTPEQLTNVNHKTGSIVQLALGPSHSCALYHTGKVRCWGNNSYGELGTGSQDPSESIDPITIEDLPLVTQITAGTSFTCALTTESSNRSVYCWGRETLSKPDPDVGIAFTRTPALTSDLENVLAIHAGSHHACAILDDAQKTIKCWGRNDEGQLGSGNRHANYKPTSPADDITGVKQLALGNAYTCALLDSGKVSCAGSNISGQLGRGASATKDRYETFATIPNFDNVHRIVGYATHVCAVHDDNQVSCWGDNDRGQLGIAEPGKVSSPQKVSID